MLVYQRVLVMHFNANHDQLDAFLPLCRRPMTHDVLKNAGRECRLGRGCLDMAKTVIMEYSWNINNRYMRVCLNKGGL